MSRNLQIALKVIAYAVGALALVMLVSKLLFHHFSNDDIIMVVFLAAILRLVAGRFSPKKEGE